jgi:hypothetical protein
MDFQFTSIGSTVVIAHDSLSYQDVTLSASDIRDLRSLIDSGSAIDLYTVCGHIYGAAHADTLCLSDSADDYSVDISVAALLAGLAST